MGIEEYTPDHANHATEFMDWVTSLFMNNPSIIFFKVEDQASEMIEVFTRLQKQHPEGGQEELFLSALINVEDRDSADKTIIIVEADARMATILDEVADQLDSQALSFYTFQDKQDSRNDVYQMEDGIEDDGWKLFSVFIFQG